MSVSKRKDGRYAKSVTIGIKDGKPVKKYIYAKTLRELDKKYRDFMAVKEHGGIQDVTTVTIEELSAQWLEAEKLPYLRPQTYENVVSQVKVMNAQFGHFRVQQLKYSDIVAVQKKLISQGKERIYNRCLYILRALLQYGIREDIVLRDVTAGAKPLKIRKQTDRRALTDAEISLLMGAELDLYSRAMIYTFYYTGMRRGELIALQRGDVNFDGHYINVSKTAIGYKKGRDLVQDFTKTSAGRRKCLMPPELEAVLREYIPTLKTDVLFPNRKGGALMVTSFRTRWTRACNTIFGEGNTPAEFTPHLLRHNFASMLYNSGTPIKAAQTLLGHASVQTTLNVYTHFDMDAFDASLFMDYVSSLSARGGQKAVSGSEESSNGAV